MSAARAGTLIALLSAGNFVIGMGAFVVIGMLNPLAEGLGVTGGEAGAVLSVYALAYAVCSPIGVALTGAWPRRTVLIVGMALFGVASLISALAPGLGPLFAARVLAAVGAGLFTPVAAGVAAAASAPQARGRALARVFFGLTLAQVLGVPAGGFIAYTLGWQASFVLVAALSVPILAGLWRLVAPDLPFQPTHLATLAATLADWRTMLSVAFTMTFMGAVYVVYTYLAPLLADRMGFGRDGITLVLLIFGLGAVAGNLIGGRLSDWIGPRRTLYGLAVAQSLLLPALSLLPVPVAVLLPFVLVWSICGWSFMAPQQALLIRLAPQSQNVVLALNAAAIYVGAAIGSAVGAQVIAARGLGAIGVFGGLGALLALANLTLAQRVARPELASTSER